MQQIPFPERIQNSLYFRDFSHQSPSRVEAALCVHASLKGRIAVPRKFLPVTVPAPLRNDFYSQVLSECLLSSISNFQQYTQRVLNYLCLPLVQIQQLSWSDRLDALAMIEEIMRDEWGPGKVVYSMMRFTPFDFEDVGDVLCMTDIHWAQQHKAVILRLKKRKEDQETFINEHLKFYQPTMPNWSKNQFSAVYKDKVDQKWQELWLDESNYKQNNDLQMVADIILQDE